METSIETMHIFKTDITAICASCPVYKALGHDKAIRSWNIDTEDADCVLRVISETLTPQYIISLLNSMGHSCSEL